MVKNTVLLDEEQIAFFKKICRLNGNKKPKTQDSIDVAIKIAESCVICLKDEEFKDITGLNK